MKTVLVKYKVWVEAPHPQLDDYQVEKSAIVEVINLTDLNHMFENISDVKILDQ